MGIKVYNPYTPSRRHTVSYTHLDVYKRQVPLMFAEAAATP